ncbi:hypothetical protein QQ056_14215 [Oscillatoria laete-virens NRMC-F 0139]|nr:hypothetical protein [Oscillatoria laete-virens]MDL5054693.1 hypothetical protein [Oscillatoria laete-virens NRMC-F 0139]
MDRKLRTDNDLSMMIEKLTEALNQEGQDVLIPSFQENVQSKPLHERTVSISHPRHDQEEQNAKASAQQIESETLPAALL